jgi:hypothetical protein
MKAFKERYPKPQLETAADNNDVELLLWTHTRIGWKAALEWVLSQAVYDPRDLGIDEGFVDKDIIEQELEE